MEINLAHPQQTFKLSETKNKYVVFEVKERLDEDTTETYYVVRGVYGQGPIVYSTGFVRKHTEYYTFHIMAIGVADYLNNWPKE